LSVALTAWGKISGSLGEDPFATKRHGRRRPAIHGLTVPIQAKSVDGRPSPTMTTGGNSPRRIPADEQENPPRSAFRRSSGDGNFAGVGLVAHAGGTLLGAVVGLTLALAVLVTLVTLTLLIVPALLITLRMLLLAALAVRLALLLGLVHGVQDTEVMFRMLEERLRRHSVATAGRVAPKLQVLLEKLLGGSADADFRPVAVENVVAIERNRTARMMADGAARSSATTTARAMVAATHALHVHTVASCFPIVGGPMGVSGTRYGRPRGLPLANHDPSTLMVAREEFAKIRPSRPGGPPRDTPATWLPYTPAVTTPNNFFAIGPRQDNRTRNFRQIKAKRRL
jgi:hypothetical protein